MKSIDWNRYEKEIHKAIRIRQFETLLLELFSQGKIFGTVHTCVGQEITPVILGKYRKPEDFWFSNHRGHGHFLTYSGAYKELIAEMMGKTTGISGGIGGSQHLHFDRFYSNGIQGGMTPIAAGTARTNQWNKNNGMSVVYIGDGTLGEGILYEAMNMCGIWNLPVLFVLEHNRYAQSTSFLQTFSGSIKDRALGFGLGYYKTDIWDIEQMDATVEHAVKEVRNNKPVFLEVDCYRLNSHSKGDDNRFESEINEYKQKDILNRYQIEFPQQYLSVSESAKAEFMEYVKQAESEPTLELLEKENLFYAAGVEQHNWTPTDSEVRMNERIYEALRTLLELPENAFLIGEDIEHKNAHTEKEYGGAFKVTKDLSQLFPGRVHNTPISEAAITGFATGLALGKHPGIVEIMFGDFTTLILDQVLQHASKITKMYGKPVALPLIIRTPMGGKRGYGPTHSQSLEKLFIGIPSVHVVALNTHIDPVTIYQNILQDEKYPAIVIENKVDYTRKVNPAQVPGFNYQATTESLPTLTISPKLKFTKPDITLFCYGGMLTDAIQAVSELVKLDIACEIVCPSSISPMNMTPLLNSVSKTRRLVVIEEGFEVGSVGTECIAWLNQHAGFYFQSVKTGNSNIIPCSKNAEYNLIPDMERIVKTVQQFYERNTLRTI